MGVRAITPAALLVPVLVKILRAKLGPQQCRRHGIGKLRRDFTAMGDLPTIAAAEHVLGDCCRACGGCSMARL